MDGQPLEAGELSDQTSARHVARQITAFAIA